MIKDLMLILQKNKSFLVINIFVLLTQLITLLRPASKSKFCGTYLTKYKYFHFRLNCDSSDFLLDSQDLHRLIDGNTSYQDRPLFPLFVHVFSRILDAVGIPNEYISYTNQQGVTAIFSVSNYLIFIAINAFGLLGAIYLALRGLSNTMSFRVNTDTRTKKLITIFIVVFFAQNEITGTFFWTPHSQIFNLFIPAYIFYFTLTKEIFTKKKFVNNLLLIAFGALVYPLTIILFPLFLWRTVKYRPRIYLLTSLFAFLPLLTWQVLLRVMGGTYSVPTVDYYRQFVWILDSISENNLINSLISNLHYFAKALPIFPMAVILISIVIFFAQNFMKNRKSVFIFLSQNIASIYSILLLGLFLYAMGFYATRIMFGLVTLLVLFTIALAIRWCIYKRFTPYVLAILIGANTVLWISNPGPLS